MNKIKKNLENRSKKIARPEWEQKQIVNGVRIVKESQSEVEIYVEFSPNSDFNKSQS